MKGASDRERPRAAAQWRQAYRLLAALWVSLGLHLALGAVHTAPPLAPVSASALEVRLLPRAAVATATLPANLMVGARTPPPAPAAAPVNAAPRPVAGAAPGPDPRYYSVAELDRLPLPLARLVPAAGVAGLARVALRIEADGRVSAVEVVAATSADALDPAARAALLAARFQPATRAGRPVRAELTLELEFGAPVSP